MAEGIDRDPEPDDPASALAGSQSSASTWVINGLIVLATVLAVATAVNIWVERQVLDTDEWVASTDDLLADDDVRHAVAAYLVDELYEAVDVRTELGSRLPDNVQRLSGLVAAALRAPATDGVDRLLATDRAQDSWSQLNRVAHERFVQVLRDDFGPGVSTADGTVTLELRELVALVGEDFGLEGQVLDRLPEDTGRIVVFESGELSTAQDAVRLVDLLSGVLFVLIILLYGIAIYLARERRRQIIRRVGAALVLASLVLLVGLRVGANAAESAIADTDDQRAVVAVVTDITTRVLHDLAVAGVVYGLVIVSFAALLGPSAVATWLRHLLAPALVGRPAATWAGSTAILLVVLYLLPNEPFETWWRGAVFLVIFAGALVMLRRRVTAEFPDARLLDTWDVFWSGLRDLRPSRS